MEISIDKKKRKKNRKNTKQKKTEQKNKRCKEYKNKNIQRVIIKAGRSDQKKKK